MFRQTPGSGLQAKAHYERAIALDARYADPHASLGFSYFYDSMVGGQPLRETASAIRTEANRALALDPADPAPHFLLGTVAIAHDYDWETARQQFELSLATLNTPAEAHWAYASLYLQPLGRFDEAARHMERAVERDPLNAHWRGIFVSHLSHAGLFDRAIREAEAAMRIDPMQFAAYSTLGEAYVMLERWSDAIPALEHAHVLGPSLSMSTGFLAAAYVRAGDPARGAEMVQALDRTARPPIGRALYHVVVEEMDLAAEWYERAIEERDPFVLVFAACPPLNALRRTSHWPRLAKLMKLPRQA
jgi:tetratricopeptide (TPR) repeat protein